MATTAEQIRNAQSLDQLLALIRDFESGETYGDIYLMTNLPTFGGEELTDTHGVWSWDATRLLVGSCRDDFEIVPRDEWSDREGR